jgi:hypothetical protein
MRPAGGRAVLCRAQRSTPPPRCRRLSVAPCSDAPRSLPAPPAASQNLLEGGEVKTRRRTDWQTTAAYTGAGLAAGTGVLALLALWDRKGRPKPSVPKIKGARRAAAWLLLAAGRSLHACVPAARPPPARLLLGHRLRASCPRLIPQPRSALAPPFPPPLQASTSPARRARTWTPRTACKWAAAGRAAPAAAPAPPASGRASEAAAAASTVSRCAWAAAWERVVPMLVMSQGVVLNAW